MRKLFRVTGVTALALGALSLGAEAQEKQVGLVLGANFATLNVGSGVDFSTGLGTRTGFVGGIFVSIPVGDGGVSIEPEVLYIYAGRHIRQCSLRRHATPLTTSRSPFSSNGPRIPVARGFTSCWDRPSASM